MKNTILATSAAAAVTLSSIGLALSPAVAFAETGASATTVTTPADAEQPIDGTALETEAPETEAPETEAPETEAPDAGTPVTDEGATPPADPQEQDTTPPVTAENTAAAPAVPKPTAPSTPTPRPAPQADVDPVVVDIRATPSLGAPITTQPGKTVVVVPGTIENKGTVTLPANNASVTFQATGGATFTPGYAPYAVGKVGQAKLAGCSIPEPATLVCTNGLPQTLSRGYYANIRVSIDIPADSLAGDAFGVTETFALRAPYENATDQVSVGNSASVPMPSPAIDSPVKAVGPTPTITGTGMRGAVARVTVGGQPAREVPVDDAGVWSLKIDEALPGGSTAISAVQVRNGVVSPVASGTLLVDADAPTTPVIDAPADFVGGAGELSGTAEPATTLIARDAAGHDLARADSDPVTGAWRLAIEGPLAEGDSEISVVAVDAVGNESPAAAVTVHVPDTTAPDAPVVTGDVAWTTGTGPLSGTAEPLARIDVTDGFGAEVGGASADAEGTWSLELASALPAGETTLLITATDEADNTSEATSVTVTVAEAVVDPDPAIEVPGGGSKPGAGAGAVLPGAPADTIAPTASASTAGSAVHSTAVGTPMRLAYTGSETAAPWIVLGSLLLVIGGALRIVRRRGDEG